MNLTRAGRQPSGTGPGERFTGTVRIDLLYREPRAFSELPIGGVAGHLVHEGEERT